MPDNIDAHRKEHIKRYKRKSKRRLTRLLAKNFDPKDFTKAPITLRLYRLLLVNGRRKVKETEDKERLESTITGLEWLSRMLKKPMSLDEQFGMWKASHPDVKDPMRETRDIFAEELDFAVSLLRSLL